MKPFIFTFNGIKPSRPVYDNTGKNAKEIFPGVSETAEAKTLAEILEDLKKEFENYETRLKENDEFFKSHTSNPDVVKAYRQYQDSYRNIRDYLLKNGYMDKKGQILFPKRTASEEEVTRRTLKDLSTSMAKARGGIEAGREGEKRKDSMDPLLGLEENGESKAVTAKRPKSRIRSEAEVKENLPKWYQEIVRKIINLAERDYEEALTEDERYSLLFVRGGETRAVTVDGQKYLLERDVQGNYLRLRDYWLNKEKAKGEAPSGREDPYICSSGKKGFVPVWENLTKTDLAQIRAKREKFKSEEGERKLAQQKEKKLDELDKNIDWIFSSAAAGSEVRFLSNMKKEKVSETEEVFTANQLRIKKHYDESVTVTYLTITQNQLKEDGKWVLQKPEEKEEKLPPGQKSKKERQRFTSAADCKLYASNLVQADSQIFAIDATPDEQEKERQAFLDKNLRRIASNLSASSVLEISRGIYAKVMEEMTAFIEKHHVVNWDQPPKEAELYHGHVVHIRNGVPNVVWENPAYVTYVGILRREKALEKKGLPSQEDLPPEKPPRYLSMNSVPGGNIGKWLESPPIVKPDERLAEDRTKKTEKKKV